MPRTRGGERFGPSVAVGAAIRSRRNELGFSQEALAAAAGLDRTYVGGLERGERNPTLKVLWVIASVLELRPSALVAAAEDRLSASPPCGSPEST